MDEVVRKKFNLLVHLAKIDGRYEQTEKEVIVSLLREAGVSESEIDSQAKAVSPGEFEGVAFRSDIMYWALRLIKADGTIHPDESAYCKALAIKIKYSPDIVDYFVSNDVGTKEEFKKKASRFSSSST